MSDPENHITLTPFDHCVPRAYYYGCVYMPLKAGVTPTQAFDLLHEGLHRLFIQIPWLNGQVYLQDPSTPSWRPGQLEIRYTPPAPAGPRPPQLKYKELDTDLDFASLRELGFPPDAFRDDDIMPPTGFFADPKVEPGPTFAAQANFVEGGCLVVSAIHHSASDTVAYYHVVRMWAAQCAAIQTDSPPPEAFAVGSDSHALLHEIWTREAPELSTDAIDPETWRLVGLDPKDMRVRQKGQILPNPENGSVWAPETGPSGPPPLPDGRRLKTAVFYLPTARLAALCDTINQELGVTSGVGTNDAVCALIWRCFLRARVATRRARGFSSPEDDSEFARTKLNLIYDGRATYSSALPPTYLGNITFNIFSEIPLSKLIAPESSLGAVTVLLRQNAGHGDQVNLLNLYNLLDHHPSYDELIRLKRRRMPTIDSNNMQVSSLMHIPLDAVCFGDGPVFGNKGCPEASRLLMDASNSFTRTCLVLPRNKNAGVEVLVGLYSEELDALMADEEFTRYALCLCRPD
ncbi:Fumigaclavine B O-acetyltransferase [Cytospora mali]|uniref:Fumigaclavine B O-acetyltransferase n=1 Tax=Cytospora mali TaxID=578113 RepID=A0A194UMU2_CYTMA|nr:Fumigaclavine B O-acetyltransferase [Valsa mali var. pyri (nom. inval.)]